MTAPRNNIKHWRQVRGLTREQLAHAMGTTDRVVAMIETGERDCTLRWLEVFAAALQVAPSDLVSSVVPDKVAITPEVSAMLNRFFE